MTELNNVGSEENSDASEMEDGGPCKWGPLTPACCQRFRSAKWVLFWLCWVAALQGMVVSGLVNVVITSIEKRFGLRSTETGTIVSCYDIASAICLLPVSYFGGLGVRPRYIAIGVIVVSLGSLLFALPHFTTGLYSAHITQDSLCNSGGNINSTCDNTFRDGSMSNYKYVFIFAMLSIGAGSSPFYTLGATYIDDSLPQRASSLYIDTSGYLPRGQVSADIYNEYKEWTLGCGKFGIYYTLNVLGTAVGYLAGGEFLNMWTDVGAVDTSSVTITTDNRRWVGAWWLGFVIGGVTLFFASIPIFGFPGILPGTSKYRQERSTEVYTNRRIDSKVDDIRSDNTLETTAAAHRPEGYSQRKFSLRNIKNSAKVLLTNPSFIFISLLASTEAMAIGGFSAFTPKFLESQFGQPAARAAQFVGFAAIPAGGGGTVLGGYLVKRFNPTVITLLKWCILCTCLIIVMMPIFLISCDSTPFAGVNTEYQNISGRRALGFLGKELDDQCNTNCGCTEEDFRPVCGRDGVMYFSPCYAGCEGLYQGSTTRYSNCSCITSDVKDYMAEFTSCESPCIWLAPFLLVFAVMMFLTFLISMPALAVTLRCVPEYDRSFALGIQYCTLRCLGAIPGPIIFGKMIDLACLLWQKRCDGDGSCFFYDNRKLSYYLMALGIVIKSLSALYLVLALVFYRTPPEDSNKTVDIKPTSNGISNPVFEISNDSTETGIEEN